METSIAYDAKFDGITRILEALKLRTQFWWTKSAQYNPHPRVVLVVNLWTMCSKSFLFFLLIKCCPNPWIPPSQGPPTIHIHKPTILVGEIIQISHGPKTPIVILGPISSTIFNHPIINISFQSRSTTFLPKSHCRQEIYRFGNFFDILHAEYQTIHI